MFVQPADLLFAARDGLIAVAAAVAVAALGLVAVSYTAVADVHASAGDFLTIAVWLTCASLGVPIREAQTDTPPSGPGVFTSAAEVRAVVWLLTTILLVLVFVLVRRRERARPSGGAAQAAVRAGLTAAAVTLVLLVLAFVTTRRSVFGFPPTFTNFAGYHTTSRIGPEPVFVLAGPLPLAAIAAAAAVCTTAPPLRRAAAELARWRPVLTLAWRQVVVSGLLGGLTLLIYTAVEISQRGGGRVTTATVIGLLLLLPNLAIYGTLAGFGATFYAKVTLGSLSPREGQSAGLFGVFRPWIVWLLLGAAVASVLIPPLLAMRRRRGDTAGYPLAGVWRAVVAGLAIAVAVVLFDALSYADTSAGYFTSGGSSTGTSASFGPSLLAAAGLTAAWLTAGYLLMTAATRRARAAPS